MSTFLVTFTSSIDSIRRELNALDSKILREKVTILQQQLQNQLAIKALPSYDAAQCHARLKALIEEVDALRRSDFVPKKKITLSKKVSEPRDTEHPADVSCTSVAACPTAQQPWTLSNAHELTVQKAFDVVTAVHLHDLHDCDVLLSGRIGTVRLVRLTRCNIRVAPEDASEPPALLLESFHSSRLDASCHQIRVHESLDSRFYLATRAGPIIESCHGLVFGPSCSETSEASVAGDAWRLVHDFSAMGPEPSPNFSLDQTRRG